MHTSIEQTWLDMLQNAPYQVPPAGALTVIAPHPDDETLGAGGLIALCAAQAQSIRIISVTRGEASHPNVLNLAQIRALELHNALACLSRAPMETTQLGLGDGAVTACESQLFRAIDEQVHRGETLVAPFEHDGHPDHDAVGRVCLKLARRRGLTLLRYPIWAWHHASPSAFHASSLIRIALPQRAQTAKRRAIACFASQLRAMNGLEPIVPDHVLKYFMRPYESFLTCRT
jgi:LmbE family N-acetylglucosaminyl deacetylase